MFKLIIVGVIAWLIISGPSLSIVGIIWPSGPAPWESVDAYYYPDPNNPKNFVVKKRLKTVEECRQWAQRKSSEFIDSPGGKYKCGVGYERHEFGKDVYRLLIK